MSRFQILGRGRAYFTGGLSGRFAPYTNIFDAITRDSAETHLKRLKANLPEAGEVTVLTLTEKQYESRDVLVHTRTNEARAVDPGSQMTLAF